MFIQYHFLIDFVLNYSVLILFKNNWNSFLTVFVFN